MKHRKLIIVPRYLSSISFLYSSTARQGTEIQLHHKGTINELKIPLRDLLKGFLCYYVAYKSIIISSVVIDRIELYYPMKMEKI